MRKFFEKSAYVVVLIFVLSTVISCEKDFTNIGSNVISNTKFDTDSIILDVVVSNLPIESIRADGLNLNFAPYSGLQGQYLLGVYINDEFENIEASIVSQIGINPSSKIVNYENPNNLQVITTIDTAFLKLPYHATLISNTDKPNYQLDSIIGNKDLPFTLNVYELDTYLSRLNPTDPAKINNYFSNATYQTKGNALNITPDIEFLPSTKDTLMIVERKNSDGALYKIDTIRYTSTANSELPLPMVIIPLKKSFAQEVFLDNFGGANFASQDVFNDYFRGIIIEAKEKNHATGERGGSLISFSMLNASALINPAIDIHYSNTFINSDNTIDTIVKNSISFRLTGIMNNKFKMTEKTYPANNEVKIQGTAGSEAKVEILNSTQLADLRNNNWLINDASLTFYINQDKDASIAPYRLHLYKAFSDTNLSQIKDKFTELSTFGGFLETTKKLDVTIKDKYTFRITDYVSDLLSGDITQSPELRLKVYTPTDEPTTDTIFRRYNWSPKAVSILNGDESLNGSRRAKLKISYSQKKD